MTAPGPYDLFVWRRLARVCRDWRAKPNDRTAADVQRVGVLAYSGAVVPVTDSHARAQLFALVDAARTFRALTPPAREAKWAAMGGGLAVIDAAAPPPHPGPAAAPPARMADPDLSAAQLPYWVE